MCLLTLASYSHALCGMVAGNQLHAGFRHRWQGHRDRYKWIYFPISRRRQNCVLLVSLSPHCCLILCSFILNVRALHVSESDSEAQDLINMNGIVKFAVHAFCISCMVQIKCSTSLTVQVLSYYCSVLWADLNAVEIKNPTRFLTVSCKVWSGVTSSDCLECQQDFQHVILKLNWRWKPFKGSNSN